MTLYKKTVVSIAVTILSLILILYAILSSILLKSYAQLEETDAIKNTERYRDAYLEELNKMDLTVKDWAQWDASYNFLAERARPLENSYFVKSEMSDATIVNLKNNIIALLDVQGRIHYVTGVDLEKGEKIDAPESFVQVVAEGKVFQKLTKPDERQVGLIMLPEGPMIFAARAVFPNSVEGASRGMIVMGRYLTDSVLDALAERTHLKTTRYRSDDPKLPEDFKANLKVANEKNPIRASVLSDNAIAGYLPLLDASSKPVMIIRVDLDRAIFHQGKTSLNYIIMTVLISGLVFGLVILVILGRIVLMRVKRLGKEVNDVKKTGDLSKRVTTDGKDELAILSTEINQMLSTIEESNQKEKKMLEQIQKEQEKSENLLLNILPGAIADRLKTSNGTIADHFTEATVLFADIVGFTEFANELPPSEVVTMLNSIFSAFDHLTEELGLEKIKTIGDNYMLVGGLPEPRPDHAQAVVEMALRMLAALEGFNRAHDQKLEMRIGINTGPVVAGVIGVRKFIYDLWGDTVNLASRMESHGIANRIQISSSTYEKVCEEYDCEPRGLIAMKGKGETMAYIVLGRKTAVAA